MLGKLNVHNGQPLMPRQLRTEKEYFAEGVQRFFNVNAYANPANDVHNDINTRNKLGQQDPELYALIKEVFPCQNVIIDPCRKSRSAEFAHNVRIDCDKEHYQPPVLPSTVN